jgi:hypothetical protein
MPTFKLLHRRRDDSRSDAAQGWEAKRAALVDGDKVLLSRTHLWLRRIPGHCQPKQLCRHYPRIANAIAETWDDQMLGDRLLNDLMVDRRGNRAGFPARIVAELHVLRRLRVRASHKADIAERIRRAFGNLASRGPPNPTRSG